MLRAHEVDTKPTFEQATARLSEIRKALMEAIDAERQASSAATAALNRRNNLQKEYEQAFAQLREAAGFNDKGAAVLR